jgi:hypothetical protein
MHTKYEEARALHRHSEARQIAARICDVLEMIEFHECHLLSSPLTVVHDPTDTEGDDVP